MEILTKERIVQILRSHGVNPGKIQSIWIMKPPLAGDNFASSVSCVSVLIMNQGYLQLFAKTHVQNPKYSQDIKDMMLFRKEAVFYQEILPLLSQFITAKTGTLFQIDYLPKCYFGDENLILMEDLTDRDFKMGNKFARHDFQTVSLVLEILAKFHAPSYALLKSEIKPRDFIEKFPTLQNVWVSKEAEAILGPMTNAWVENAVLLLEQRLVPGCEYGLKFLNSIQPDVLHKMNRSCVPDLDSKFLCIIHGDTWINNMMFKEQDAGTKIALVDLQIASLGSPVLDISTYLFTSALAEVRENNGWKRCLAIYYQHFSRYVKLLGVDVSFTIQELEDEFRDRYLHGFMVGLCCTVALQGFDAMKDLDGTVGNMAEQNDAAVKKWMREHPDEAKSVSTEAIKLLEQHQEIANIL